MPLSLRMLSRDWRAGELRILALALVLAVGAVTSVGFFADRIRQALTRDAHQLLGGDVLVVADHPWNADWRNELARRGLSSAETQTFVSMARAGQAAQLAAVKAVSTGFPLRGRLRIAPQLNAPEQETSEVPERGSAWVDERLAGALGLRVGDRLEVGDASLRIAAILTLEPDRSPSFINLSPRLMMRVEDLAATGLVQEGSRVQYALLGAGGREAVRGFEAWARTRLGRGERIESLDNARPEIRGSLERGERFVGLTALLAVILSAVAVALATRRHIRTHLDGYAVMRCLGASQRRLASLAALEFVWLALAASLVGSALGFAAQYAIAALVSDIMQVNLPAPSAWPLAHGVLTGLVLLLGFAIPPLLQLRDVPALRVLRRDVGPPRQHTLLAALAGIGALAALLVWQAGDARLGLVVVAGFGGAIVVFGLGATAALRVLGRLVGMSGVRGSWRYGLANLRRHERANAVQVLALALGLTAVLMLTFTRNDLLATWQASVPPDAPNRFVINIQPEQRAAVEQAFREAGLEPPPLFPMVRGRFVARNGRAVGGDDFDGRDRRLVDREFNLSFGATLPPSNRVASGRWFSREDLQRGGLSVEAGIARRLGWQVGDTLSWQVAGRTISAPIVNIRELNWDSMNVNFFVYTTPGLLEQAPASYITAFHLDDPHAAFTNSLSQRFPNLTVIDTAALLRQVKTILDQVVAAVQFVFLFALAAGVLVLYAALLATQDERRHEAAVMRALGAARGQVLAAQRAEFAALGLVAGMLGSLGAVAIGWAVAHFVLHFDYRVDPWIWVAGPAAGLLCVSLNAWSGARAALNHAPMLALREGA